MSVVRQWTLGLCPPLGRCEYAAVAVGVHVWMWGCMHLFEPLLQLFWGYFSILQRKEG